MGEKLHKKIILRYILIIACILPLCGKAAYFDTLAHLSLADKIEVTQDIYIKKLVKLDAAGAIHALKDLIEHSEKKEDYAMVVLGYDFLGRYYFDNDQIPAGVAHYEKAIAISQEHKTKIMEAKATHDLGYQYYQKQEYPKGFEYMLRGNDLMSEIGYSKYPNITRYLYELSYAYYHMGYYEKAIVYLKEAIKNRKSDSIYDIWVNNTLALAYRNQGKDDSAFHFYHITLKYAQQRNDTVWIGIAGGNIADIYMSRSEYDKAYPLLRLDFEASSHYKEWNSASNTMMSFAKIAMAKGDLQLAHRQLDTAMQLMKKEKQPQNIWMWRTSYYAVLARLYHREQKMALAYDALDSNFTASRHLWSNDNIQMLNQVESKIALEKHLAELKLVESERSRLLIRRNAIIVVLILLIVIALQSLRRMRLKQKKDKEIYELEVKRAEDEIQNARQLLASYTERLQKNSQLIQNFEEQMLQKQEDTHDEEEVDTDTFDKLNSFTILKEEDWQEFKALFSKVYPDFFRKLHDKHPDLTQSETRFLALSKLGLSIKEMGHTLGVSPNSVRKTRERLRKKITITEQEFLKEIFPE